MTKFALGVQSEFSAEHYLVGGDFGPECELHGHDYRVEVILEGDELDEHGFLVDIVRVKSELGSLVERYRDTTLNEHAELADVNPGCEELSRVFAESLRESLPTGTLESRTVKIWENREAWAQCRLEL